MNFESAITGVVVAIGLLLVSLRQWISERAIKQHLDNQDHQAAIDRQRAINDAHLDTVAKADIAKKVETVRTVAEEAAKTLAVKTEDATADLKREAAKLAEKTEITASKVDSVYHALNELVQQLSPKDQHKIPEG